MQDDWPGESDSGGLDSRESDSGGSDSEQLRPTVFRTELLGGSGSRR